MRRKILYGFLSLIAIYLCYDIFLIVTADGLSDVPQEQILGNPDGDLTVVEFMDYTCPYCRDIHPTLINAINKDGHIRLIVRPIALRNEEGKNAALLLYAAAKQGKFVQTHNFLIDNPAVLDDDIAYQSAAGSLGLNAKEIQDDINSRHVRRSVQQNNNFFLKVGTNVTPTFVLNEKTIYIPEEGMPSVQDLLELFADARQTQ